MWGEQQSYFGPLLVPAVVAARAASIRFHASERKRVLPDGSLELMLRCRGERELLHEMQHPDWQGEVTIDE